MRMKKGHWIAFGLGILAGVVFQPQIAKLPGISKLPTV
jgi:hypothetical protein